MPNPTLLAFALLLAVPAAAQLNPPVVLQGTAPSGDVRSMPSTHNSMASLGDGSIVVLLYRQTSSTTGGHLALAVSTGNAQTWNAFYPLPHNTAHQLHDPDSGVLCAGRECNIVHVVWADRSLDATYHSAFYQAFDTTTRTWVGQPLLLAAADPTKLQRIYTHDITVTPRGSLAVAVGVGANGGLGMGAWDSALVVRPAGATAFGAPQPMRSGGAAWSRNASIVAVDEVVHCAFKNSWGAGGICYRSFDASSSTWRETAHVPVGPGNNGTSQTQGINAGHNAVITADTRGGRYILYVTGSAGGIASNNKMRMAYAAPGNGSKNADWQDLEVLAHDTRLGMNPRGVSNPDPAYPLLQGGDTEYFNYTVSAGYQGSLIVVYSKAHEDFQNKYIQVWQYGVNLPIPTKEISFWPDTEPYMFERLVSMRSTGSVGQAAWLVYGKNDKPSPGQAPNGQVRLWLVTPSTGRTVSFGTGCLGSHGQVPKLHADDQFAQIGNPYYVECERFPILANFIMALGTKCQPLDLGAIGAPGCTLEIDFPVLAPLQVDVTGYLKLTWNVPNDVSLIDRYFFSQAFVRDPRGNSAGAITSNALRTVISL